MNMLPLAAAVLTAAVLTAAPALAGPKEDALAKCQADYPEIPAAQIKVRKEGNGFRCYRNQALDSSSAAPTAPEQPTPYAAPAPAPAPAPALATPKTPRILVVDRKEVKVWGLPPSRHFTKNNLFGNFWGKCPTGLVRADEITDPVILAKYKDPNVDYLYHFVCLDTPPQ